MRGALTVLGSTAVLMTIGLIMSIALEPGGPEPGWRKASYPPLFGYELRHPSDWARIFAILNNDDAPGALTLWLTKGADRVQLEVNFQGGWCEGGKRQQISDIVVSGIAGRHYECYADTCPEPPLPRCEPKPYEIVRYFGNVKGRQNYVIIGRPTADVDTVRRIVQSFRFLP
jgi:hypothetical protein